MNLPVIALYPGRFQPMGLHHKLTFDWVVSTFGYDNSFIVSSGKVELPKSPLSFHEKQSVALAHGITPDKFIATRSPYMPIEVIKMLEAARGLFLQDFSIVFVVGKKDMDDDPRFTPGYKKDGSPSYFQYYDQSSPMASADTHGYLIVAPHSCIRLPDNSECSGTNLRNYLANASPQEFQAAMGFYDEGIYSMARKKFTTQAINEHAQYDSHFKTVMGAGYNGIKQALELAYSMGLSSQDLPWDHDTVMKYMMHGPESEVEDVLLVVGWSKKKLQDEGQKAHEEWRSKYDIYGAPLQESTQYDSHFKPLMDSGYDGIKQAMELADSLGIPSQELPWTLQSVEEYINSSGSWEIDYGWDKSMHELLEPTGWTYEDWYMHLAERDRIDRSGRAAHWDRMERTLGLRDPILTESEKDRSDLILGTPAYEEYVAELIRDIQHVKKSLRSRTKKGSKHRKEAARLQNAIDSLKFMGRKNQRAILDNNRLDERVINVAVPEEKVWNNRTTQKEDLTRDEIKSYFYRIKRQ